MKTEEMFPLTMKTLKRIRTKLEKELKKMEKVHGKTHCEDCGKKSGHLINNPDKEHGDFYQCEDCYYKWVESWEKRK